MFLAEGVVRALSVHIVSPQGSGPTTAPHPSLPVHAAKIHTWTRVVQNCYRLRSPSCHDFSNRGPCVTGHKSVLHYPNVDVLAVLTWMNIVDLMEQVELGDPFHRAYEKGGEYAE